MPADAMTVEFLPHKTLKCPFCKRDFLLFEIEKAKSTGKIRCPLCRLEFDLKDVPEG